jgi:hypothetical protein
MLAAPSQAQGKPFGPHRKVPHPLKNEGCGTHLHHS